MFRKIGIATTVVIVLLFLGYISLEDISTGIGKIQSLTGNSAEETITHVEPIRTLNKESISEKETQETTREEIKLTTEQLQATLDTTPAFQDFPEDGSFVLGFFDGNGQIMQDQYFTVEGNQVRLGKDNNADFTIVTGNYWIPDIQATSDFCEVFQDIKESQDYLLQRKIGVLKAAIKYKNLMKYKSCIS